MAGLSKPIRMVAGREAGLLADFADLFATLKALFDPYRPERHYMRGPGPAWHAKHNALSASLQAQ